MKHVVCPTELVNPQRFWADARRFVQLAEEPPPDLPCECTR